MLLQILAEQAATVMHPTNGQQRSPPHRSVQLRKLPAARRTLGRWSVGKVRTENGGYGCGRLSGWDGPEHLRLLFFVKCSRFDIATCQQPNQVFC